MKKFFVTLCLLYFSSSVVLADWYNDSNVFQVFISEANDNYLIHKLKKFDDLKQGNIAVAVIEVDDLENANAAKAYKELKLASVPDAKYLMIVAYQLRDTTNVSLDIEVGAGWAEIFDNKERKYILNTIIEKSNSGSMFDAYNDAINYVIEKSIGKVAAEEYTSLPVSRSYIAYMPQPKGNPAGIALCLLIMALARFVYSFLNGGIVFRKSNSTQKTAYQKFYSENFNSLKVIAWLLISTRIFSIFRPKDFGKGFSGGGGAGGSW